MTLNCMIGIAVVTVNNLSGIQLGMRSSQVINTMRRWEAKMLGISWSGLFLLNHGVAMMIRSINIKNRSKKIEFRLLNFVFSWKNWFLWDNKNFKFRSFNTKKKNSKTLVFVFHCYFQAFASVSNHYKFLYAYFGSKQLRKITGADT